MEQSSVVAKMQSNEEFVKFLGKGAYGSVDLIKYTKTDGSSFLAAVKTSYAEILEDYNALKREIQILSELKGYPNIVICYEDDLEEGFNDHGHQVYKLLLEYANEGSLRSFMENYTDKKLPDPMIRDFTRMILEGLVSIHSHGYVHCDLKSDNLLIFSRKDASSYELKISDFGNCREVGEVPDHWEIDFPFVGTPIYMPPESLIDGAAKKTLDLWSLGCLVLEMYTGEKPWAGVGIVDLVNFLSDGEAPDIPECVPCDAREFIETCFAREHEKRGNASELMLHPFLCPEEKTEKIVVAVAKEKKTLLVKLKLRIKRASKITMDIREKPLKLKMFPSKPTQLKKLLSKLLRFYYVKIWVSFNFAEFSGSSTMVTRLRLVSRSSRYATVKFTESFSASCSCRLFSASTDPESESQPAQAPPTNPVTGDEERHEKLRNLRVLLQQNRIETARGVLYSLLRSDSAPFTSPKELFSAFSLSSPSLKHDFSYLLLSVLLNESKMISEAADLFFALRNEGIFPSSDSLTLLLDHLVKTKQFRVTINVFLNILESDFRPSKFMYGKAIQAAVKLSDVGKGLELFNRMKHDRISPTVFIYNVLIDGLCKVRQMKDAEQLFDEMLARRLLPSLITYNTLIDGYCKDGNPEKSFKVRERMKADNIEPSLITFNTLLKGLFKAGMVEDAENVLTEMKDQGFVPDAFTFSILFDGYSSNDKADAALGVYETAVDSGLKMNAYTCSILLNALCKEGQIEKAEEILGREMAKGLVPNEVLYNTMIDGYSRKGDLVGARMKIDAMEKQGMKPDHLAYNCLIRTFCELGDMENAEQEVNKMKLKGVSPSVETYNILIGGYGRKYEFDKCFDLLKEMEDNGTMPNVVSYGTLINCLCKGSKLLEAQIVKRDMEDRGVSPNVRIYNMLIDGCCSKGKIEDAFRFSEEMFKKGIELNLVTYNTLIDGLSMNGKLAEAEDMLLEISRKGLKPDVFTYNSLISGYRFAGNVQRCIALYEEMKTSGIKPTLKTYHLLISLCTKEGIELTKKIFGEMSLQPDLLVYNGVLHCYAVHGDMDKAFNLQKQMIEKSIGLDKTTYNSLILGQLKVGKLCEVRSLIDEMKAREMEPEADTYDIIVKGHCEMKDYMGAYVWYREMQEKGLLLDVCIGDELVSGLKEEWRSKEAENVISEMNGRKLGDVIVDEDLSATERSFENQECVLQDKYF
ncbi:hypothetical protein ARALYDRAFT_350399 [Arabidopsis lyrata subsp. lyrata]|uniref:Protein kinase domain-containing protein n=2 Tax=Arabidopsis lyrata subsp. lyrata TaxID=81972 RepID=D7M4F9_ARALL|nr:hypothetical protein ARALYDRAFT_350399 [Arabidopsis lyrata subsp. lyrata]